MISLIGCEKEGLSLEDEIQKTENSIESTILVKGDDIQNNKKLQQILSQFTNNTTGRTSISQSLILKEEAILIRSNNYHSYTFLVLSDPASSKNSYRTLTLKYDEVTENYNGLLIDYGSSENYFQNMPENQVLSHSPGQVYLFPDGKCRRMDGVDQYTDGTFVADWVEVDCTSDAEPVDECLREDCSGAGGNPDTSLPSNGSTDPINNDPTPGLGEIDDTFNPRFEDIIIVPGGGSWHYPREIKDNTVITTPSVSLPFWNLYTNILSEEEKT